MEIWVQVHGLPFGYTSRNILEAVGNFVGLFIKFDERNFEVVHQSFMRIRVAIDVRRPLRRRMKLTKRDGTISWVSFKYERLGTFCYFCGILGHVGKHCAVAIQSDLPPDQWPYNDEIRAANRKRVTEVGARWLRQGSSGSGHVPESTMMCLRGTQSEDTETGMFAKRKRGVNDEMLVEINSAAIDGNIIHETAGRSGGIVLMWNKECQASLISYSFNHVDVSIRFGCEVEWRFTGFYGHPKWSQRSDSWTLLRSLKDRSPLPWVVVGDFNDICASHEKKGGNPRPPSFIDGFNDALSFCGLVDMGMQGHPFTWEWKKYSPEWVEERLDRAVASNDWLDIFPNCVVHNIATLRSDHSAILLCLSGQTQSRGPRCFKFENCWLKEDGFRTVFTSAWDRHGSMPFLKRLNYCGKELQSWGRDHFNRKTLEIEDSYWRQRAKQFWIKEGDRNTKYFHNFASHRKRKNRLVRLRDERGAWQEGAHLNTLVFDFYTKLFSDTAEGMIGEDILREVDCHHVKVTEGQNRELLRPFCAEEIKSALFAMHPDKAPGPDGLNPAFFQCCWNEDFGKYLGLPSFIGKNKSEIFSFILDKIRHRIGGWHTRLLSKAGKEILLKTVAQAMPQYAMSVFALPISTCQRIEGLMNKFWWQSDGKNSSGIHWLSWKRMTKPKKFGGLGFKDIHAFNLAMLGKQGWRLLTKPHSLLSKVFKARYYPKSSFLEASTGPNPSFVWRSILVAQPLIKDVIRRRVGNGEGTLIWADPWLWDSSNPRVPTLKPSFCPDFPVRLLLNDSRASWNELTVRAWFNPADCDRILMVPISPSLQDDWYWPLEASGCYSVKSAYRKLAGEATNATGFTHWCMLWKLKVPPKVNVCMWRALRGILPLCEILTKKGVELDNICPTCGAEGESLEHVFMACPMAVAVWSYRRLLWRRTAVLSLGQRRCSPTPRAALLCCLWQVLGQYGRLEM
ncbi:unnamed protein product [Cuscuta campestris]|uniref:CCHC-type domain-containing protein n=1 Tax=Cuscuta campestris TaxID=132261 RepID=A0A484KB32_9ASTE|nr:unnamed protein product [Cuscuta campestris]